MGSLALALSMFACYGTLAATMLLPLAGITLTVNPALWAGTIVALAAVALVSVATGPGRRAGYAALGLALAGFGMLAYVQFFDYSLGLELLAFALLAASVALDFRYRREIHSDAHPLRVQEEPFK